MKRLDSAYDKAKALIAAGGISAHQAMKKANIGYNAFKLREAREKGDTLNYRVKKKNKIKFIDLPSPKKEENVAIIVCSPSQAIEIARGLK